MILYSDAANELGQLGDCDFLVSVKRNFGAKSIFPLHLLHAKNCRVLPSFPRRRCRRLVSCKLCEPLSKIRENRAVGRPVAR